MTATAVLLPGTGYTAQRPLLHWSGVILRQRGWRVEEVAWSPGEDDFADPSAFVERALPRAFLESTGPRMIVAKSFGCFALPWALREGVPGAWLTPVLTEASMAAALAAAPPEHLAVGGSADPLWAPVGVPSAAELITVPGADHSLEVPGDWPASLAAQRTVLDAVDRLVAAVEG